MPELYCTKISENISRIMVTKLNLYDSASDIQWFINLIQKFDISQTIYFMIHCIDDYFLEEYELESYKKKIDHYFNLYGRYEIIDYKRENRFFAIGKLKLDNDNIHILTDIYNYFDGVNFFLTHDLDWSSFRQLCIDHRNDKGLLGLLSKNICSSVFLKGHDGDYFEFNYLETESLIAFTKQVFNL